MSVLSKWPWSSNWLEDLNLCLNVALRRLLEGFHMGRLAVPGQVLLLRVFWRQGYLCRTVKLLMELAGRNQQWSGPELPKSQSWRNCLNRLLLPPCTAGSGCTLAQPAKYPTTFKQLHPGKTFFIFLKCRTNKYEALPGWPRQSWLPPSEKWSHPSPWKQRAPEPRSFLTSLFLSVQN